MNKINYRGSINGFSLCHKLVTEAFGHMRSVHFSVESGPYAKFNLIKGETSDTKTSVAC